MSMRGWRSGRHGEYDGKSGAASDGGDGDEENDDDYRGFAILVGTRSSGQWRIAGGATGGCAGI